jgi:hypothetical protein
MQAIRSERWLPIVFACLMIASDAKPACARQCPDAQVHDSEGAVLKKLGLIATAKPLETATGDDDLRKLLKARYNTAVRVLAQDVEHYSQGRGMVDTLLPALRQVRDSRLELSDSSADHLVVLEVYSELARSIERLRDCQADAGRASIREVEQSRYTRLDAEIQLLRCRRKLKLLDGAERDRAGP